VGPEVLMCIDDETHWHLSIGVLVSKAGSLSHIAAARRSLRHPSFRGSLSERTVNRQPVTVWQSSVPGASRICVGRLVPRMPHQLNRVLNFQHRQIFTVPLHLEDVNGT